jgi:hypothetical protein
VRAGRSTAPTHKDGFDTMPGKSTDQPLRHGARLQSDPLELLSAGAQHLGQGIRGNRDLHLPDEVPIMVHDAGRRDIWKSGTRPTLRPPTNCDRIAGEGARLRAAGEF